MCGTKPSPTVTPEKTALFDSLFPHVLGIPQPDCTRRDSTALGIIRTLSRIDRIFINLPMAEAQDIHCYSHVFENLGNRIILSDHAAVRLVIQKPTNRGQQCKHITNWIFSHTVLWSILKRLLDILPIHLAHLLSSKLFLKRPRGTLFVSCQGIHLITWEQSY